MLRENTAFCTLRFLVLSVSEWMIQLKEFTPELIHEFIDRIIVYVPRYLDGKRVQLMDIYYNSVGAPRKLNPGEMEEAFQEHLAERERSKTKTA